MFKVQFYFYQHSPRIHISNLSSLPYIPVVGDILTVYKNEFLAINKDIIKKHYCLEFKVSERQIRMIPTIRHYSDVRIKLELITNIKTKKNGRK